MIYNFMNAMTNLFYFLALQDYFEESAKSLGKINFLIIVIICVFGFSLIIYFLIYFLFQRIRIKFTDRLKQFYGEDLIIQIVPTLNLFRQRLFSKDNFLLFFTEDKIIIGGVSGKFEYSANLYYTELKRFIIYEKRNRDESDIEFISNSEKKFPLKYTLPSSTVAAIVSQVLKKKNIDTLYVLSDRKFISI